MNPAGLVKWCLALRLGGELLGLAGSRKAEACEATNNGSQRVGDKLVSPGGETATDDHDQDRRTDDARPECLVRMHLLSLRFDLQAKRLRLGLNAGDSEIPLGLDADQVCLRSGCVRLALSEGRSGCAEYRKNLVSGVDSERCGISHSGLPGYMAADLNMADSLARAREWDRIADAWEKLGAACEALQRGER